MIIANTVALSWDHYPIGKESTTILEYSNLTFSVIFIIEMVIKLTGMGFRGYIRDFYNIYDSIIVGISVVDIGLVYSHVLETEGGAISAMRGFRLLRIFKLAKSWKELQELLKTIAKTLKDVSYFSLLLFIFISTYSLLGM